MPPKSDKKLLNERTLPNVIEYERIVLGTCLEVAGAFDVVSVKLEATDFHHGAHIEIYSLMLQMGQSNDIINISTLLQKITLLEKEELREHVLNCSDCLCVLENIDYYVDKIIAKSKQRSLIMFGLRIQQICFSGEEDSVILDKVDHEYQVARHDRSESNISSANDMMVLTLDDMHSRHQGKVMGYKTGIYELDNTIGEFAKGDMIVIAGRPSMGKTAIATSIMINQIRSGIRVGFLSLEMKKKAIGYRMISVESGLNLYKIMHGMTAKNEALDLQRAISRIANYPLWIDDTPNLTWMKVKSFARQMIARYGIQILYIDHLHKMDYVDQNPTTGYEKITKGISAMGKELDIPTVLLSQLKRLDAKKKNDRRPTLDDLRWSGSIEQDADTVILIHREEYYTKSADDKGKAELIVAKQRNGPTETANCYFNSMCAHFKSSEAGF